MSVIRLIVNADDLGAGRERDRGIFHAFRKGIVTSASLLANGPSFVEAVQEAQNLGLPAGVHLNLAEGAALTGPIAGLTDAGGKFLGKEQSRKVLAAGGCAREGVRKELMAQVGKVFAAGLVPDHLDTHQHFCLFPEAAPLVLETADCFGIRALRRPTPAEPEAADPGGALGNELALYRHLAPGLAAVCEDAHLCTPDGLWGMPFLDRLDQAALVGILEHLPSGVWELMVHPGYPDFVSPFSGPAREVELAALISPSAREMIRARNIRLIAFGDLVCGS